MAHPKGVSLVNVLKATDLYYDGTAMYLPFGALFTNMVLLRWGAWISNLPQCLILDVITYPCPNLDIHFGR